MPDMNKIAFQSKAEHPRTEYVYRDAIACFILRHVIGLPPPLYGTESRIDITLYI